MARWIEPEPEGVDPLELSHEPIRASERLDPRISLVASSNVHGDDDELLAWVRTRQAVGNPHAVIKSDDEVIAERERSARVRAERRQRMLAARHARR